MFNILQSNKLRFLSVYGIINICGMLGEHKKELANHEPGPISFQAFLFFILSGIIMWVESQEMGSTAFIKQRIIIIYHGSKDFLRKYGF